MFARHLTLGRAVIVIAGLLVFVGLVSQVWASGAPTAYWAGVFAAAIAAFAAAVLIGRTIGGYTAVRLGRDQEQGRMTGIRLMMLALWIALLTYDQLFAR